MVNVKESVERSFCPELEEDFSSQSLLHLQESSSSVVEKVKVEEEEVKGEKLVETIRKNLIGEQEKFNSAYGDKMITYGDYTASGRSIKCIEDYIQHSVLPLYGNTHTTTSITGLQTTCFRHEARQIIAQSVNAKITGRGAEDCVLFTGSGSTSAINKLVVAMGLHIPWDFTQPDCQRPVVFVGPFEHHSNLLPWRESSAEVIMIQENEDGDLDTQHLIGMLKLYSERPIKIGSFSAASNLTGFLTDVDQVTSILHRFGAFSFWDYAACAPYVKIDMNPIGISASPNGSELDSGHASVYKDAIFISGHKFVGGPGTPGVLVAKKRLFSNSVPSVPGGGTVFYVTDSDHRYLSNRSEREEGGTPDNIGSIRLGLAFELKERVGHDLIENLEERNLNLVMQSLSKSDNIIIVGSKKSNKIKKQLPIVSFLIRYQKRFLHYNFVCALLNDLFGIQTRGGCQCAGPYGQRILGLSKQNNYALENVLIEDKKEILRPGFSRISFPYFLSTDDVQYMLDAIHFLAEKGWIFLSDYKFNHKTGEWKHHTRFTKFPNRKWISRFNFESPLYGASKSLESQSEHRTMNLQLANEMFHKLLAERSKGSERSSTQSLMLDDEKDKLRWFVYPSEVTIGGHDQQITGNVLGPVRPQEYSDNSFSPAISVDENEKTAVRCKDNSCCKPKPVVTKENQLNGVEISGRQEGRQTGGKYPLRDVTVCSTGSETTPFSHVSLTADKINKQVKEAALFPKVPQKIMRLVGQAVIQWGMIKEGDRLLLGLSGGKDSLTLLHVLLQLQKRAPVKFEIACATVDPQTPSFDPSPLKDYLKKLNVPYHYLSEGIIERAKCEMTGDSLCSFCSRMKRGILYTCCRKQRFNKLVLAQHLDDLAESFIMSAMHNGQIRTMKANYWNSERDIQVIRPLVYVREDAMKKFAYDSRLPVINENCPACFEEPKERQRVKKMLFHEENLFPDMYYNFRRALLPFMDEGVYEHINKARAKIESKKFNSNARKETTNSAPIDSKVVNKCQDRIVEISNLDSYSDDDLIAELEKRKRLKAHNVL